MSEPQVEGSQARSWNYLRTHSLTGLVADVGLQLGVLGASVESVWAPWGASQHGGWSPQSKYPPKRMPAKSCSLL